MAKFSGKIGFIETKEIEPGVWLPQIIEKTYYGDLLKNTRRWERSESVNDNLNILNQISILSDSFVQEHIAFMKYVKFSGMAFCITSAEISYPRIILTLGGVYNGEQA